MLTVADIVYDQLDKNGYDGLFRPGECSCEKDDLMPCMESNIVSACSPGHKHPGDDDHVFYISAEPYNPSINSDIDRPENLQ